MISLLQMWINYTNKMRSTSIKLSHLQVRVFVFLIAILQYTVVVSQNREKLIEEIHVILQNEIDQSNIPGAVILLKQGNEEIYKKAFGYAYLKDFANQRVDTPEKTTIHHLYDLASLTKVVGTTTSIMLLVDKGSIDLNDPVSKYIEGFDTDEKKDITIRHLLTHTAGLYEWYPFYYFTDTRQNVYKIISKLPLKYPVGESRHYSDLGFMLLGEIIENVSQLPLDEFMQRYIFNPLQMENTSYNPLTKRLASSIAATSHGNPFEKRMIRDSTLGFTIDSIHPDKWNKWRKYTLKGEVNDGNTWYANNGISGHAGLFSTAEDLQKLIDMLMNGGKTENGSFISESTIHQFLTQDQFNNGLGWVMDPKSAYLKNVPEGSYGHTGFTGTSIVVIPKYDFSIILLINRQNMGLLPNKVYYNVNPIREKIITQVLTYCSQ